MIVIDASAAIALVLNEDTGDLTLGNLQALANDTVIAPSHWAAEVGSSLVTNMRRKRLDPRQLSSVIAQLEGLEVTIEAPPALPQMTSIADIAMNLGLTYYDAAYVHTAHARQASLFTFDRKMRDAASRLNISILPHRSMAHD